MPPRRQGQAFDPTRHRWSCRAPPDSRRPRGVRRAAPGPRPLRRAPGLRPGPAPSTTCPGSGSCPLGRPAAARQMPACTRCLLRPSGRPGRCQAPLGLGTGSTRSSQSASSWAVQAVSPLELEVAVEALCSRLQQGVSATVAHLLDLAAPKRVRGPARAPGPQEPPAVDLRAAVAAVHAGRPRAAGVRPLGPRGPSPRTPPTRCTPSWAAAAEDGGCVPDAGGPRPGPRERPGAGATPGTWTAWWPACRPGGAGNAKQLASFLHGNAAALQTDQRPLSQGRRGWPPAPHPPADKASSIQSRPCPRPPSSPPRTLLTGSTGERRGGWMEDYDYVHLQVGAPGWEALTPSRLSRPGAGMGARPGLGEPLGPSLFPGQPGPGVPPSLSQALGPMWPHHQGPAAPQGWLPVTCKGRLVWRLRLVLFGEVNPEVQAKAKILARRGRTAKWGQWAQLGL